MTDRPNLFKTAQLSQYHLMGVVIPGACTLLGLYAHDLWLNHAYNIDKLMSHLSPAFTEGRGWLASLVVIVLFLIVLLVGHCVASLSSLLIDRMLASRLYGYPYKRLLYRCFIPSFRGQGKRVCSQASYVLLTIYVLALGFILPLIGRTSGRILFIGLLIWLTFVLVLTASIIIASTKVRVSNISDKIDKHTDDKMKFPPEYRERSDIQKYWEDTQKQRREKAADVKNAIKENVPVMVRLMAGAFELMSLPMQLFRLRGAFTRDFQQRCFETFCRVFGRIPSESNAFWLPALSVISRHGPQPAHIFAIFNQYQLMRNLTMSVYILFIYQIVWDIFVQLHGGLQAIPCWQHYTWISCTLLVHFAFKMRYWNVYYNWYTKTVFRCFVIDNMPYTDSNTEN